MLGGTLGVSEQSLFKDVILPLLNYVNSLLGERERGLVRAHTHVLTAPGGREFTEAYWLDDSGPSLTTCGL